MIGAGYLSMVAVAGTGLAAVPPPPVQAMFDTAGTAAAAGDWAAALAGYEALDRRLPKSATRSRAIVLARRGSALVHLDRKEEAVEPLLAALADLPTKDASLIPDRYQATYDLALISESRLEFDLARRRYAEAAAAAPSDLDRIAAQVGSVRTGMFEDPAGAATQAGSLVQEVTDKKLGDKALRAAVRTLQGRALLNQQRFSEARKALQQAVVELGGLSLKVDVADLAARSDFAIAALLSGADEDARQYLTYTAAGHLKTPFSTGSTMDPPPCGQASGLKPDDVAVIEFGIADDGRVTNVTPIYASRSGPVALAFARAVRDWSWDDDAVKGIPLLFRALTRVELRCSAASDRPSVKEMLNAAAREWLEAQGARYDTPAASSAPGSAEARIDLARAEATRGADAVTLIPLLDTIASATQDREEALSAIDRALAIARKAHAPAALLASFSLERVEVDLYPGNAATRGQRRRARLLEANALAALSNDPVIAADAAAHAALLLIRADLYGLADQRASGLPLLDQIVTDRRLLPQDPYRVGALLRIAAIKVETNELAAARSAYAQTGLTEQQCALVDAKPSLVKSNINSTLFPQEALRWGFDGWARTEFDIAADGSTRNVRAIVAYPPFIFSPAGVKGLKSASFTQSYRPQGGLGCGGQQQTIRFLPPQH